MRSKRCRSTRRSLARRYGKRDYKGLISTKMFYVYSVQPSLIYILGGRIRINRLEYKIREEKDKYTHRERRGCSRHREKEKTWKKEPLQMRQGREPDRRVN